MSYLRSALILRSSILALTVSLLVAVQVAACRTPTPEWADGASIAGQVLDSAGRPVQGAEINISRRQRAVGRSLRAMTPSDSQRTVSDRQGRFRFQDLPSGSLWWVGATKDGFQFQADRMARVPALEPFEIRLKSAASLHGRVLDHRGNPVAEATVGVVAMDGRPRPQQAGPPARTDVDGSFSLRRRSPSGPVEVRIDHPDFQPFRRRVMLHADEPNRLHTALVPGLQLKVDVLGNGRGIDDATVSLTALHERSEPRSLSRGPYAFDRLPPGAYVLRARHAEFPRRELRLDVRRDGPRAVTLSFERTYTVGGRAVDDTGRPLLDARVGAVPISGRPVDRTAVVDDRGRFRLQVARGSYRLTVHHQGRSLIHDLPPVSVEGPIDDLRLHTVPGRPIKVVLRGAAADIEHLELWARGGPRVEVPGGAYRTSTVSFELAPSTDGALEAHGHLYPGDWQLLVEDRRDGRRAMASLLVDPHEPEPRAPRVATLDVAAGRPVSGTVRLDGRGVDGWNVMLVPGGELPFHQPQTITFQGGGFHFAGVPEGSYSLRLRGPAALAHAQQLELDDAPQSDSDRPHPVPIDVELRSRAVDGVVTFVDGSPVTGAKVALHRPPTTADEVIRGAPEGLAYTDSQGRFRFDRVVIGKWTLVASTPEFVPRSRSVDLASNPEPDEPDGIKLVLEPAVPVILHVEPACATDDRLRYTAARLPRQHLAYRRLDGTFFIDTLPRGRHRLRLMHRPDRPTELDIEIPTGEPIRVSCPAG